MSWQCSAAKQEAFKEFKYQWRACGEVTGAMARADLDKRYKVSEQACRRKLHCPLALPELLSETGTLTS